MTENNTNPPEDRADGPTDDQGSASEQIDPRRLAAERLSYLAVLQFQDRRRGGRRAEPWRDPRHGQGRALALLKLKPEMTQRELTYLMGMSRQSIAELLRKLEGQGLVERRPSEEDRRTVLVSLTEAGRAIDQDQDSAASSRPGLLDCLSDEEAATLAEFLGRIIDVLEERVGGDLEHRREMVAEFWRSRAAGPHPHGDHPGPTGFPGFPGFPGFGPWGGPGGAPVPPPEGPCGPEGHEGFERFEGHGGHGGFEGPEDQGSRGAGHHRHGHGPHGPRSHPGSRWAGGRPGK